MNNIIKLKLVSVILASVALFTGCSDDYMDTFPTGSTSTETIFQDTDAAKMAINGMARLMVNQNTSYGQVFAGEGTIKFLFGEYLGEHFSRPNLSSWASIMSGNSLDSNTSSYSVYPWYYYYMLMGNANEFLANIDNAAGSEAERKFLKAQAYVYRAYCYTQLVQFYCHRWVDSSNGTSVSNLKEGLVIRTEENKEEKDLPLSSSGEVYTLIYSDLDNAISLFTESGLSRTNIWEPNINVAYAVYARAAITKQDYGVAKDMAAKARSGINLMTNAEYFAGFSESNQEWIWGSYGGSDQPLHYYGFHSYMAYDAGTSVNRGNPVCMSKTLYDKLPATDIRRELFLDPGEDNYNKTTGMVSTAFQTQVQAAHPTMTSAHRVAAYMSFKFSIAGEIGVGYINHFRASEMYLIEAEAKYFTNDETGAQALMNELVRDSKRDEAYECNASGEELLKEIKFYRAVELWGEGFDWLDKKRYNEPMVRLSFADGGNFHTTCAGTREIGHRNGWTYVTPLKESENNDAMR